MSQEDIDRLLAEKNLVRQTFDDREVAGFWAKAVSSYTDARVPGISGSGGLQLAYTAGLQATFTVLAACGLRIKGTASHYKAFYALGKLDDPVLRRYAIKFDELRTTRHESIYEPEDDLREVAGRLADALTTLEEALPAMRAWLIAMQPSLASRLPPVRP